MPQTFTHKDLACHSQPGDLWIAIDDKVYDVSEFADEHPGGNEVLLEEARGDATAAFESVGHSDEARRMLKEYYLGDIDPASQPAALSRSSTHKSSKESWILAGLVLLLGLLTGFLIFKP